MRIEMMALSFCVNSLGKTEPGREGILLRDVDEPKEFVISDLELVSLFEKDELYIPAGSEPFHRAKQKGAILGQRHALCLLANQTEIPEDWRDYNLVFPATAWLSPNPDYSHYTIMPALNWSDLFGGSWYVFKYWSGYREWTRRDRVVICRLPFCHGKIEG